MNLSLDFGPHLHLDPGVSLRLSGVRLSDEEFADVCRRNDGWRFEREPEGALVVRPVLGGVTGLQVAALNRQVGEWADRTGQGVAIGPDAGIRLRNGAIRSASAAVVTASRWASASPGRRRSSCLPFCADFVAEVVSPFDDRAALLDRMLEYRENGARLGWLIDPAWRTVDVFRPGEAVRRLEDVTHVVERHQDPVLPGFVLDLRRLWNAATAPL